MTTPRTRQAYLAIYQILDQALASPAGARLKVESHDAAVNLRMRIHASRAVDRESNSQIYEKGHHLWWASIYDVLQVRLEVDPSDSHCWVLIEPRIPKLIGTIEPITPNPEDYLWQRSLTDQRPIEATFEEAPSFLPNTGSHSGTRLLTKNSDSGSESQSDDSSSTPSTKPEPEPAIQNLRRL